MTSTKRNSAAKLPSLRSETKAMFRTAILQAAEEVFDERGFHGARIQDIAERARIGVGTVYNHFAQKEDVLRALVEERGAEIFREFSQRDDDPTHWEDRLRARYRRLGAYVEQHRHYFRVACGLGLMSHGGPDTARLLGPKHAERAQMIMGEFQKMVREGMQLGILLPGDAARVTRFLSGAVRSIVEGALRDGVENLQPEVDLVIDLFLRATCVHPPGKRPGQK